MSLQNSVMQVCLTSDVLNEAGKLHNDYQVYLVSKLKASNIDFLDTINLIKFVNKVGQDFFSTKKGFSEKIEKEQTSLPMLRCGTVFNGVDFNNENYSIEGSKILSELQVLVSKYNEENDNIFFDELLLLRNRALELKDEKEVITVGLPIVQAYYSFKFWKENGQTMLDLFSNDNVIKGKGPSPYYLQKPKINLYQIGGADLGGAIQGATGGGITGPGGAFAGAVLVSSVASLGNLCHQVISSYVSWWPW